MDTMCPSCGSNITGNLSPHLCSIRTERGWTWELPRHLTLPELSRYHDYFAQAADQRCPMYNSEESEICICDEIGEAQQVMDEVERRLGEVGQ